MLQVEKHAVTFPQLLTYAAKVMKHAAKMVAVNLLMQNAAQIINAVQQLIQRAAQMVNVVHQLIQYAVPIIAAPQHMPHVVVLGVAQMLIQYVAVHTVVQVEQLAVLENVVSMDDDQ